MAALRIEFLRNIREGILPVLRIRSRPVRRGRPDILP